jgi:TRAP-type C4-dicarboxylate transport system substrate-binding protein
MPSPEMYTALQRGIVDSTYIGPDSYSSYKLWEVAPYITTFEHPMGVHAMKMNLKSWNKIPAEHQKKIMAIGVETMESIHPKLEKIYKDLYEVLRSRGVKFHAPSDKLRKDMDDAIAPVWQKYIKLAGDPGREIYRILFPGKPVPES